MAFGEEHFPSQENLCCMVVITDPGFHHRRAPLMGSALEKAVCPRYRPHRGMCCPLWRWDWMPGGAGVNSCGSSAASGAGCKDSAWGSGQLGPSGSMPPWRGGGSFLVSVGQRLGCPGKYVVNDVPVTRWCGESGVLGQLCQLCLRPQCGRGSPRPSWTPAFSLKGEVGASMPNQRPNSTLDL